MSYKTNLIKAKISYLGGVKHSAKIMKSYIHNVCTYCIYLAPYNTSGHQVCPNAEYCKDLCLNTSGHNKANILATGYDESIINQARIRKTKLFFENRDLFMEILIHELKKYKKFAEEHNMQFAVRLNGTSDISPLAFHYKGKNILELFPDVMFYDYTKVPTRMLLSYKNYDVTFSYDGHNWGTCEEWLKLGGKVAVVFASHEMPTKFKGFNVVDANTSDARFLDPQGSIMGLAFHPIVKDGKIYKCENIDDADFDTSFVVRVDNNDEVSFV